ncbi:RNA polymerase sigma factor [Streptomyces sp. NPDC058086]|uniref:RNA polymerase sigma factor n=1 Tax=Streptomyces sp. NPDC058086 TaxID=3346334 RepID=UPI0036F09F40
MSDQEPLEADASTRLPPAVPPRSDGSQEPACATGAAQAEFPAFYRRFLPTLVAFLMWQGAPGDRATDLAQETMIKAYNKWHDIRSPQAWTRRVASRELVRYFSRVEEEPVDQVPDTAASLLPRPDELAEWECKHELLNLLKLLPPRQRQVLAWSMTGYTPSQIAEELGLTPETVRGNLRKVRLSVASHMKAWEEDQ